MRVRFRKKSVVIEAMRVPEMKGDNFVPVAAWLGEGNNWAADEYGVIIRTLDDMRAYPGDWIIRNEKGQLYPCRPDVFAATYEPVEGG